MGESHDSYGFFQIARFQFELLGKKQFQSQVLALRCSHATIIGQTTPQPEIRRSRSEPGS